MTKLYVIFLLSAIFANAQNPELDSLNRLLSVPTNSQRRLELLSEMNDALQSDLPKAVDITRQGLDLAKKTNDKNWLPQFHEKLGRNYANSLKLDSAMVNFNRAMKGYVAIGDKMRQATTYFKIGWVLKKRGDLKAAMQNDLKALQLMEEIGDKAGIAGANSRISGDLRQQGRLEDALAYATKNIAYCTKYNLPEELMFSYTAAGDATIHLNRYGEALSYFMNSLKLAHELEMGAMSLADQSNNVGNANKRLGRYNVALKHYEEAKKYAEQAQYTNAIITVTANLGEIHLLLGNYPTALTYQLQAVGLMEKHHDISNLTENYLHTSTIYEKLGNYPKALEFHKKVLRMRDSISKLESDKSMSEMLTKYGSEKKEATIASQKQRISNQKSINVLSFGVAGLLMAFLFFGFRSYRMRTRANKLLAAKNAENELLMKEIHHRVKNNLELVKSLISLQSAHLEDPAAKSAMIESQNRVQSMGIIHQKLYQGQHLGSIEMKDYFVNLGDGILDSFGADDKISIECTMEPLELDVDTAVPIGLIVNELVTNSLKYAFPDGAHGKISIRLERTDHNELTLHFSDNGIGKSSENISRGTGFGTQLVRLLTTQLDGTMQERILDGTHTEFRFRIHSA